MGTILVTHPLTGSAGCKHFEPSIRKKIEAPQIDGILSSDLGIFYTMIEDAGDCFYIADLNDHARMIYVNAEAEQHYGCSRDTIYSWNVPDWDPNFKSEDVQNLVETIINARSLTIESTHRLYDGTIVPVEVSINYLQTRDGKDLAYGWFKNISERVEAEQHKSLNRELHEKIMEIERLSVTDPLTGAGNRRHFENTAVQEIERAHRFKEALSIIILDVDFFKQINDSLGHMGGDSALIQTTREIRQCIRSIDVLARWGGDELVVLLPHTPLNDAVGVAEKIRRTVDVHCATEDVKITLSLGVAALNKGDSLSELIKRADRALYRSKERGRNCVSHDMGDATAYGRK